MYNIFSLWIKTMRLLFITGYINSCIPSIFIELGFDIIDYVYTCPKCNESLVICPECYGWTYLEVDDDCPTCQGMGMISASRIDGEISK